MAWFIVILVLIAIAFGILGAVVKAVAFIVLTIVFTVLALGAVAYFAVKRQTKRFTSDTNDRRQLPS
ncbi:MAG: hypothetical protein ABI635_01900 [Actinomycetota bacterium]